LLLNFTTLKPTVSFRGGQEYLEAHPSQVSIAQAVIMFIGNVLNISNTNMEAVGSKKEDVIRILRKLHSEKLHNLYSLSYVKATSPSRMR
jgi:hypothetical protein